MKWKDVDRVEELLKRMETGELTNLEIQVALRILLKELLESQWD